MNWALWVGAGFVAYSGLNYISQIGKPRETPTTTVTVITVILVAGLTTVMALAAWRMT